MPDQSFEQTALWMKTLGAKGPKSESIARERLRATFRKFRERAGMLAGEISSELRDFTVHDISHADALWELTDTLIGTSLTFNPVEAFILGGTFVLHDLGMALAAYSVGDNIDSQPEWGGLIKSLLKRRLGRVPTKAEVNNISQEIRSEAIALLLRTLHARQAESLAVKGWAAPDGSEMFLISDDEIRNELGHLIGRLAYSHGWNASRLVSEFGKKVGIPASFPPTWKAIDPLGIALSLRLADAAHIDSRRAPRFLQLLRKPKGIAAQHWTFQSKLHRPLINGDRLQYTGSPFAFEDASAWWLCYDTLGMIDDELRKADNINAEMNRKPFTVRGVFGVNDPEQIAIHISTVGWSPVDAKIKIGNVASLIRRLGGEELYGKNGLVPLRELLQNASDAVRARREIESRDAKWGRVEVSVGTDLHGPFIQIKDTGVGMSRAVLTGPFLDFGTSFWSSPEAMMEFPRLAESDFDSTGRFGIGFFSVFMWGDRVAVTTRRFDAALADTFVLTFQGGLGMRPILHVAGSSEQLTEPGTSIRVWPRGIKSTSDEWISYNTEQIMPSIGPRHPATALRWLCSAYDVDLHFEDIQLDKRSILSKSSEWQKIQPDSFLRQLGLHTFLADKTDLECAAKNLRPMKENGVIVARCCIAPGLEAGCIAVGGLRNGISPGIAGVLLGATDRAARDRAKFLISRASLDNWVKEQTELIETNCPPAMQASSAILLATLEANVDKLFIAMCGKQWLKFEEVVAWVRSKNTVVVLDSGDERELQNFSDSEISSDFLRIPLVLPELGYIVLRETEKPLPLAGEDSSSHRVRPILLAVSRAWGVPLNKLFTSFNTGIDVGLNRTILVSGLEISKG